MLEHMSESINITMPFIFIALLGVLLKRRGLISDEFVNQGNKIIFYFGIPITLFNHIHRADLSEVLDLNFLIFNSLWLIAFFIVVWFLARKLMKDKDSVSSFVNSAYRSSLSVVGPPLLVLMFYINNYNPILLSKGILAISVLLIISYATASILFAAEDPNSKKAGFKGILISIIKNPIIIAVIIGLVVNFVFTSLGWQLPTFASNTVNSFSGIVMPLAMICVGANLKFHGFDRKFKYVMISSFVKLIIMPIAAVAVAYLFGFRGGDLTIIMLLNALPMAVGAYVMQAELGGDSYIGASVLMLTMVISAFTLTLYIFLFRVMGFLV